jgi:hypothetical protein
MTREERDLHGVLASGSDHLTAYNLYAEAVNHHGTVGSVYGLPRHLFEAGVTEWCERRGVLLKAIEDAALGVASVYRALELPLPATLPYAGKDLRQGWSELVARIMPFDLVIDELTADGRPARVSKTSVAGSWGPVAGNLRYFADRSGTPRASIEGTTLSYDLVRRHAAWGPPTVQVSGGGRRQGMVVARRLSYFGFELETEVEPLDGTIPLDLRPVAREAMVSALMEGTTRHAAGGTVARAVGTLREWWRRSGGTLDAASDAQTRERLAIQLGEVESWARFLATPLALDPVRLVPAETRSQLDALPGMVRLRGDAAPIEYQVEQGQGIARIWLREGQAWRVTEEELPAVDRPLRFGVAREDGPILAASLGELRAKLSAAPRPERRPDRERRGARGGRRPGPRRRR